MADTTAKKEKDKAANEPREYVVYEVKGDGLTYLGSTQAKSSKEARRAVAQAKLKQEQLAAGVSLLAITSNAVKSGSGVARVKVEQRWDD